MVSYGIEELTRVIVSVDLQKLEYFGDEYIPEYAWVELERLRRERSYQDYITTAMMFISGNTAGLENRRYLPKTLNELLDPEEIKPEISVEEIKKKQKATLKRLFGGEKK